MTHTDGGEIEYDKTTAIHAETLIREVKRYEILYNKHLQEYADMPQKEQIWENIHQALFPNYDYLSEETKNVIKRTVRKRWKSLRDALVKDHRLRTENSAYKRKKMGPLVQEMQFLIPYINTPRQKNKRDNSDNYDEDNYSPDYCKLVNDTIDLTFQEDADDSNVQIDDEDIISSEALYPSVRLTISESESGEVEWRNGYCVSATNDYKSTLNYTIREVDEPATQPQPEEGYQGGNENSSSRKRKRTNSESELQSKIIDLIDRCNTESQDEDRMFLLSLLSDFKRVSVQKKLKVKSAFVAALAQALE